MCVLLENPTLSLCRNPLVSSELMKKRMQGRKMIKIPSISSRVKGSDIEGDWVTMGVVVDKLPPRESVKGNKYTVWKLSDLSSQSAVVSLFLFGKAYQEHWKMVQGSVVALLNPTIMPSKEVVTATHCNPSPPVTPLPPIDRYCRHKFKTSCPLSGLVPEVDASRNVPRLYSLSSTHQGWTQVHELCQDVGRWILRLPHSGSLQEDEDWQNGMPGRVREVACFC